MRTLDQALAPAAAVVISPGDGSAFIVTEEDVPRLAALVYAVECVMSRWAKHDGDDLVRLLDAYLDLIYRGDPPIGEEPTP